MLTHSVRRSPIAEGRSGSTITRNLAKTCLFAFRSASVSKGLCTRGILVAHTHPSSVQFLIHSTAREHVGYKFAGLRGVSGPVMLSFTLPQPQGAVGVGAAGVAPEPPGAPGAPGQPELLLRPREARASTGPFNRPYR